MERLCQSQPNPTKVVFHWVVVFDWNVHNPNPFIIDLRENFTGSIPESWYRKKWEDDHRQQKVKLRIFPDRIMSAFCKIEKGKIFVVCLLLFLIT